MTFPSLGEIVIFAKGKQSRKLKPLASLSRELPANPQLIQTWEFVKSLMKSFFLRTKARYTDQKEKKRQQPLHVCNKTVGRIYIGLYHFLLSQGDTPYTNTPPCFMCCHSQVCVVTEMVQCLKPRQIWYFWEITCSSLCLSPSWGRQVGSCTLLWRPLFKRTNVFYAVKSHVFVPAQHSDVIFYPST